MTAKLEGMQAAGTNTKFGGTYAIVHKRRMLFEILFLNIELLHGLTACSTSTHIISHTHKTCIGCIHTNSSAAWKNHTSSNSIVWNWELHEESFQEFPLEVSPK
jgi:hypothetical protein